MAQNNDQKHTESDIIRYLTMIVQDDLRNTDPGLLSFTIVEISPDHSRAWITLSTSGTTEEQQETVDDLNDHAGEIRTRRSEAMNIHHVPSPEFKLDLSREREEEVQPVNPDEVVLVSRLPEGRRVSVETSLREMNMQKGSTVCIRPMSVRSHRSSSNKMP